MVCLGPPPWLAWQPHWYLNECDNQVTLSKNSMPPGRVSKFLFLPLPLLEGFGHAPTHTTLHCHCLRIKSTSQEGILSSLWLQTTSLVFSPLTSLLPAATPFTFKSALTSFTLMSPNSYTIQVTLLKHSVMLAYSQTL